MIGSLLLLTSSFTSALSGLSSSSFPTIYFTPLTLPIMIGFTGFSITRASISPFTNSPSSIILAVGNRLTVPSMRVHVLSFPVKSDSFTSLLCTTQHVAPESYKHSTCSPLTLTSCGFISSFSLDTSSEIALPVTTFSPSCSFSLTTTRSSADSCLCVSIISSSVVFFLVGLLSCTRIAAAVCLSNPLLYLDIEMTCGLSPCIHNRPDSYHSFAFLLSCHLFPEVHC